MSTNEPLIAGEDWPAWAYRTGRITREDIHFFRAQIAREKRQVTASAGRGVELSNTEAVLQLLYPALPAVRRIQAAAQGLSAQPSEDDLYDWLFSGTQAEQRQKWHDHTNRINREEAQRIAASSDELDREFELLTPEGARKARHAAEDAALAEYMTEGDWRNLFGPTSGY